jgi:hypothetical protein
VMVIEAEMVDGIADQGACWRVPGRTPRRRTAGPPTLG